MTEKLQKQQSLLYLDKVFSARQGSIETLDKEVIPSHKSSISSCSEESETMNVASSFQSTNSIEFPASDIFESVEPQETLKVSKIADPLKFFQYMNNYEKDSHNQKIREQPILLSTLILINYSLTNLPQQCSS